jgi:FAD/FMN-containing dehydrogenase
MIDGGLVIDLRLMRGVHVDVERRSALVAAGTLLWELDRETQAHGLAVTAGTVSHTGVGGLTLYGGIGRLMRKHGLTIDNVLSFDVVTADGQWRHVDGDHEPDLFWALRGGGGDFGVVTHFTFQLHPVGPTIYGGYLGWPIEQAKDVFMAIRDRLEDAPEELTVQFILSTGPEIELMPEALQGRRCLLMPITWIGNDLDEGERVIAPFRERVPPTLDMVGRFPYTMIQAGSDGLAPHGLRNIAVYSGFLPDLTEEIFDTALAEAETFPSSKSLVEFSLAGAAVARVAPDATAGASFRGAKYTFTVASNSSGPSNDAACRAWTSHADTALAPFRLPGRYLNFVTGDDENGVREALGEETYARLTEIKEAYDPHGVFSRNPNKRLAREPQTV